MGNYVAFFQKSFEFLLVNGAYFLTDFIIFTAHRYTTGSIFVLGSTLLVRLNVIV